MARVRQDPRLLDTLNASLDIFRRARAANPQRCFEIVGEWQAKILKGLSEPIEVVTVDWRYREPVKADDVPGIVKELRGNA